jgi:acylpyruvate hydrolase
LNTSHILFTDYILTIDMTARNVQEEAKKKGLPWTIAKGFDTFLPVSQVIPKSAIPDPHNVRLILTVNGEARQDDSTELMIFRIPRQLSDIARVMSLEPGDIVITGTPKGVGRVDVGDRMQAAIEVNGKVIEESRIDVVVADKPGPYKVAQT